MLCVPAMCDLHEKLSKLTRECTEIQEMNWEVFTLPVPRFEALPARLLAHLFVTLILYFLFHALVPEYCN